MVVLPAPLGPRKPTTLAPLDGEGDVVDGGQAGEALGEAVDLDHRHADRLVASWGWVCWSMTTMVTAQAGVRRRAGSGLSATSTGVVGGVGLRR